MSHEVMYLIIVYLFAALIAVPVAKKLGLGSVLGYLFAGIIIGPFVLDLAGDSHDIMHAAEFGVVMMLFMIGMELEPRKLWNMRARILGLGGLQVLLTTLLVGGMTFALITQSLKQAVVIGMTLALSSTAIVLQTLREKGLSKTSLGESCFSVLLFQDMAVIPMMAVIPLLGAAEAGAEEGSLVLEILYAFGAVAGTVLAGLFLIKPFFRLLARTRLRELFTTAALFLVVAVSYLMESVGLSPALGAFLAGVVLAESEFRHELETAIEPFKSLMMGVFFVSVGATMDFKILSNDPLLVAGCVAGLVFAKTLVLQLIGLVFKLVAQLRWSFSLNLAQGGEFAFVLTGFALTAQILSKDLYGLINIVVAVSMVVTPLLMLMDEKLIQPRYQLGTDDDETDLDAISREAGENRVVIAGFGRFGQIVGRYLRYNGVNSTILDLDSNMIDLLRKAGFKVFYGDATRIDLLHAAEVGHAEVFIVAVDERSVANQIVETVKHQFPHLKILVRAIDRRHAFELTAMGVDHFKMETFSSALDVGMEALARLGFSRFHAYKNAQLFESYDSRKLTEMAEHWGDQKTFFIKEREKTAALESMLNMDRKKDSHLSADQFWRAGNPNKR